MSRVISRVKDLGQRALAVKEALERAPETVAGIRQTFAETTDQLQQLRSEVQDTVVELKAEAPPVNIGEAIREIRSSAQVLRKAGVEITGVDLETRPAQRLVVHLKVVEQVPPSTTKALLAEHPDPTAVHVLLASLDQVGAVVRGIQFDRLALKEILVTIGAVPSVRVCWRAPEPAGDGGLAPPARIAPLTSFFEARPASSAIAAAPAPPSVVEPAAPAPTAPVLEIGKWTRESLDRFKKMPTSSKYGK